MIKVLMVSPIEQNVLNIPVTVICRLAENYKSGVANINNISRVLLYSRKKESLCCVTVCWYVCSKVNRFIAMHVCVFLAHTCACLCGLTAECY